MQRTALALLVVVPAVLSSSAAADRRVFTYTYEYKTVPQGRTAIELWHTQSRDSWDTSRPQAMEHVLEVEHGLTDRWDAALYWVFDQTLGDAMTPDTPFSFHELKVETRYRFADRAGPRHAQHGTGPEHQIAFGLAIEFVDGQAERVVPPFQRLRAQRLATGTNTAQGNIMTTLWTFH